MKKIVLICMFLFSFTIIYAADVFINGVKVTGIRDQEIKNCTIVIDKDGNIMISAPDVKIVNDTGKIKKEYYVSLSFSAPLQDEFTLSVNGKQALKIGKGESESLLELNNFFQKGENIISYSALPSQTPVKIKITIGSGEKKDGSIEFSPISEQDGEISHLGAAGNFKFVAE